MPVSGQLSRTTGEGPAITSWFSRCLSATGIRFLVILCPPGNWAFLAVGLPVLLPGPDPDGVATFRAHELRPGWVPSLPRGLRCPHGRQVIPGRRMPPCSGPSLYPRPATHHRRLLITRHHQGFTVVHPSGLPLACSPRVEQGPLGLFPRASHPAVTGGACRGGDRHRGHLPELRHHRWSSTQRSHSPRATSCRTDLIRACAPFRAPIPNGSWPGRRTADSVPGSRRQVSTALPRAPLSGALKTDRAPAGGRESGSLLGCRARPPGAGREHCSLGR